MAKKTVFDFGSVDDVMAAVDRFAPPDSTGKLKLLREKLLATLPEKTNVSMDEVTELLAFHLFCAALNTDEIAAAVKALFISNPYFSEAALNLILAKVNTYPSLQSDDGQSVYVGNSEPVQTEATPLTDEEVAVTPDAEVEIVEEEVTWAVPAIAYPPEVEEDDATDFNQMKLPALKQYAKDNDIDLTGLAKKPEIIAKLIEATQAKGNY